jgi:hypothetical protein
VGIERVPPDLRRLGFLDEAVLWGNPRRPPARAGRQALLVPALGLVPALAATVVGAVVGNALNRFTGGVLRNASRYLEGEHLRGC